MSTQFTNYGLCPFKTLRAWMEVCNAEQEEKLTSIVVAGSTILRAQHWIDWDVEDWDIWGPIGQLKTFIEWLLSRIATPHAEQMASYAHRGWSSPDERLRSKKSPWKICNRGNVLIARYRADSINLNFISELTISGRMPRLEAFDLVECGYQYNIVHGDWRTPSGDIIPRLPRFDQWTMRTIDGHLVMKTFMRKVWNEYSTMDNDAERTQVLYRVVGWYYQTAMNRYDKYRDRAEVTGIKLVKKNISDDYELADRTLHFHFSLYAQSRILHETE